MIKLNDNNIIVGQIKQILHTFNLPQCQVGSMYYSPGRTFITRDHILRWDETNPMQVINCDVYKYGKSYLNLTTTLPIRNMIYDRETHRYLGKYLRFLRNYNNVNLMSMYNCWDGEIYRSKLRFPKNGPDKEVKEFIEFRTGSNNTIVYKIPISISDFTISLHGTHTMELCVFADTDNSGDFITSTTDSNSNTDTNETSITFTQRIAQKTYVKKKVSGCFTYSPFNNFTALDQINMSDIDTALTDEQELSKFLYDHDQQLYILLKISENINTSPVILEGIYADKFNTSQKYFKYKPYVKSSKAQPLLIASPQSLLLQNMRSIEAAQNDSVYALLESSGLQLFVSDKYHIDGNHVAESGFQVIPQLLSLENTHDQYLLGDRLIEYLTNNAITPLSDYYEIKRVQKALDSIRTAIRYLPDADANINIQGNTATRLAAKYRDVLTFKSKSMLNNPRYLGIWHTLDLYDLKAIAHESKLVLNYDTLGYLDKDLEEILKGVLDDVEV